MSAKTANLLCLLVAMIWGGGFIATDLVLETFSPFAMLVCRFAGAAVLAWIPVLMKREKPDRSEVIKGSLSGILLYAAFAFQTFGMDLTEPGMNAFLTSVNVVIVPVLALVFLNKKPDRIIIAAGLVCLAGIGCLSLSSGKFEFRFGDFLSLMCAVFFAAQIVSLEYAKGCRVSVINAIQLSAAGICSLPFGLMTDWPSSVNGVTILGLLYSIVLATFVCYLLQTAAQQHTSAASASILLGTECLWANLFSVLILHQPESPVMIFGGLLIFASILLVEGQGILFRKRRKEILSAEETL